MNKAIILIDTSNNSAEIAREAVKKYCGIFSVSIDFIHCKNANEMGAMLSMGKKVQMLIVNKRMEQQEVNTFQAGFSRYKGEPPLLLIAGEQKELLNKKFDPGKILFNIVVDKDFIYDCLRLYLSDADRKMDNRIFREILISVVDVVYQNTKEKLTPLSVSESKAENEDQDVSSVLAFYGEGIKGTLVIGTSLELLTLFATKMLYCEESDLTNEMLDDVMGEIANQVLGIIRNALSEYGYELNSSMQLVVTGKDHHFHTNTGGHYYVLPFSVNNLEFKVTFCYDTYAIKLDRLKTFQEKKSSRVLDIRLLNDIIDIIPQTIELNTKHKVTREGIEVLKADSYQTNALHSIHGRSDQGGYLIALDMPEDAAKAFVSKMLFCELSDVTHLMMTDAIGELLNQIQGNQKKKSEEYGYTFQNIFHCSFSSEMNIQYLIKNPGYYCRIIFKTDNGMYFTCCFGMDSFFAPKVLDGSDLVKSLKGF